MHNAGLDEAQAGIKIGGRNINILRYADDITLTAESEEELKSLLMKMKESEKTGLKLNIQKTKIPPPSAPAPSIQYCASNLDWQLVSYMIFYSCSFLTWQQSIFLTCLLFPPFDFLFSLTMIVPSQVISFQAA